MPYYTFKPIYQERVWGGQNLATKLGRTLPDDRPYGESWELVDRPEAQSLVSSGPDQGLSLRDLILHQSNRVMGPDWDPQRPFPILVKWLDCQERLSLQVHPPASVAADLGGEPKTENWFVADCRSDAAILVGLHKPTTPEAFAGALEAGRGEAMVQRLPCQPGLSMFVPSGRLHAIDAGNLILEIQQNSDTTYRVDDWGRVGLDGKPRQLHLRESLASIDFSDVEPQPLLPKPGHQALVRSPVFNLDKHPLETGQRLVFKAGEQPRLLSLVSGQLVNLDHPDQRVQASETILLPFSESFTFQASEPSLVLETSGFVDQ